MQLLHFQSINALLQPHPLAAAITVLQVPTIGVSCEGASNLRQLNAVTALLIHQLNHTRFLPRHHAGATIGVCCEDASNLRQLNAEAGRQGTQLNVLIDVNVGQDRCGVDEPERAAELALLAEELPHVRFAGIQVRRTCDC